MLKDGKTVIISLRSCKIWSTSITKNSLTFLYADKATLSNQGVSLAIAEILEICNLGLRLLRKHHPSHHHKQERQ